MKKVLFLILTLTFGLVRSALAGSEVVIIQSSRFRPYAEAEVNLEKVLATRSPVSGVKSIQLTTITRYILSEEPSPVLLKLAIENQKPDLLVAIGSDALAFADELSSTSLLYLLVPRPQSLLKNHPHSTGILMKIPPAEQLQAMKRILPETKRVGLIYDPDKSGHFVQQAQTAAREFGISLLTKQTGSAREVSRLLAEMRGKVDVFWMLPDLTVISPRTIEEIFMFSIRNNVPVLTFSGKYLKKGAAVAITFDVAAMGAQAGQMARQILLSKGTDEPHPEFAEKLKIEINKKVLKKMNVEYKF